MTNKTYTYGTPEYILLHKKNLVLKRPSEVGACLNLARGYTVDTHVSADERFWAMLRAGVLVMCCDCGEAKKPTEFFTDARKRNGLYSNCKDCHRRLDRERKYAIRIQERFGQSLPRAA